MHRDVGGWQLQDASRNSAKYVKQGFWKNRTVAEHLSDIVRATPDRTAVIENDQRVTFRALDVQSTHLAQALIGRGLKPGDTISFQLPNWSEAVVIALAAAKAGLVIGPITPIYREAEVGFMLRDSRSKLLFVPTSFRNHDYAEMAKSLRSGCDQEFDIVTVRGEADGCTSYEAMIAEQCTAHAMPGADPNAIKLIMYTSGTTGRAKGVLHSHNSIQSENWMRQQQIGIGQDDILYNPSPVTHVTGCLYSLCMPFTLGITTILADVWDPVAAVDAMARHRATGMIASTIFLEGLLEEAKRVNEHLPDLRFYLCGGAQVRPELIAEASAYFRNCVFSRIYGATEVPNVTGGVASRQESALGAETDGRIFGCEARIVNPHTGKELPVGEEGEIIARGPQMLVGYTRPEDFEDAVDHDGYFHMGDLGRIVEGNCILVTGRKKDVIIRAGENISPQEVENVLRGHSAIADIAIVAMPSARTGELACAFVIPEKGEQIELPAIARFLIAAGMAKQKIPEHLVIVDELPRTAIGKIRKDVLRDRARKIAAGTQSPAAAEEG